MLSDNFGAGNLFIFLCLSGAFGKAATESTGQLFPLLAIEEPKYI